MTDQPLLPFRDIRVLDLAQGLAGPYAAGMMATMGADVIKVEPPEGDWGRLMGVTGQGSSSMSLPANWGKRGLCVDAGGERGRGVLQRLAGAADLIVESFRPGVLAKLGVDYKRLAAERPTLVLASISGYGQQGAYARRPGADSIIQAMSGMASMNRDADGQPRRIGMLAVDMITGLYAGFAISSALCEQRASGRGRHLEISLLQAASAFQITALLQNLMRDGRSGTPVTAPSGFFPTRNGMIAVTCLRDAMFVALCKVLGGDEWVEDPRYQTNAARLENADALSALLAEELVQRDRDDWVEALNAAGVLCGPVNEYADLVADEHAREVGVFTEVDTPAFGNLPLAGLPGAGLAPDALRPEPALGGDTRAVLSEAGYDAGTIDDLIASRVCFQAPGH